jgi:CubicO group peptidase (beta-lactamase class C family)
MHRTFLLLFTFAFAVNAYAQRSAALQPHRGPLREIVPVAAMREPAFPCQSSIFNTSTSLDSFFAAYMATNHIPGLAACIVKKNTIVWQGYYGYANLASNIFASSNTSFMLASISKTFVVTALMQLHEQGRFRLDDSINAFLSFPVRNPTYPGIPITFKMLLTHTSSIRDDDFINTLSAPGDPTEPLGSFLRDYLVPGYAHYDASKNYFAAQPGTFWDYSNIGAALAGYLVEVISGVPFDTYCKDHIFTPLRMTNTAWFLRELDTSLVAHPYQFAGGFHIDQGLYGYPDYPDGSLRTTVPSLARFLLANIGGGQLEGTRVLDSATIRTIRSVYVDTCSFAPDAKWGLIWFIRTAINGHVLWGHTGGDLGVMTSMFISESDSTGAIMLTNGPYGFDWKIGAGRLMSEAETLPGVANVAYVRNAQFSRLGIDTLQITTRVHNPSGHVLNVEAMLKDGFGTLLDSVSLKDDGFHGDSASGDGLYGFQYVPRKDDDIRLNVRIDDATAGGASIAANAATYRFARRSILNVSLSAITLGLVSDFYPVRDTSFVISNTGFGSDLIHVKIDSGSVSPSAALAVHPAEFLLPGHSSRICSVSVSPKLLPRNVNLSAKIIVDADSSLGQTHFEIVLRFRVVTDVPANVPTLPIEYALEQCYPNPFNPSTTIRYGLPARTHVVLTIFNTLGQQLSVLRNGEQEAGYHEVQFEGKNLSSGVYFYRMQAGEFVQTRQLLLLK